MAIEPSVDAAPATKYSSDPSERAKQLCACGCGGDAPWAPSRRRYAKYIRGHNMTHAIRLDDSKRVAKNAKISASHTGISLSDSHRAAISEGTRAGMAQMSSEARADMRAKISANSKKAWAEGVYDGASPKVFKDTVPELKLKALLDARGITYKQHPNVEGRVPDFLVGDDLILEVNGCYWHACAECGRDERLEQREVDASKYQQLTDAGYDVCVVWEHELV